MSSTAAWAASSSAGTPSSRKGERGGGAGEEEAEDDDDEEFCAQVAERANSSSGSQAEASQASPTSLENAPGMVRNALMQARSWSLGVHVLLKWWK
jgi:hypothetical protein